MVALVDTWAIGHLPDPALLGAIAIGGFIFSYIYWAFGFLRMGTTGMVAQAHGAGDDARVDRVTMRSVALGLLIALAVLLLQDPIVRLAFAAFAPGEELASHVQQYLDIRIWAVPAVLVRVAVVGFLIGLQQTKIALFLELALNLLNALLNLWFVVGLGWGVEGVAMGSLIAEFMAGAVALLVVMALRGKACLGQLGRRAFWRLQAFAPLIKVNGLLFIRTLLMLGVFALVYRLSTALGTEVLAANHVLLTFTTLVALGLDALAYAAEALVGESIGMNSRARLRQFVRVTTVWAIAMSLAYTVVFWLFGMDIIYALTDQVAVRDAATAQMGLFVLLPLVAVWCYQLDGIFIGATRSADMMWTMLIALLGFVVASSLLADNNRGLWLAFLVFFALRGLGLAFRYPALARSVAEQ